MGKETIDMFVKHYSSPCGDILLSATENALYQCDWEGKPCAEHNTNIILSKLNARQCFGTTEILNRAAIQLDEYFERKRKTFDLPIALTGTAFQKAVWKTLLEIPYGRTATYKDIAMKIGKPQGARAVAQAIGANKLAIIVPCHRIIGSNGSLTGFAGGLKAKSFLLKTEGSICVKQ